MCVLPQVFGQDGGHRERIVYSRQELLDLRPSADIPLPTTDFNHHGNVHGSQKKTRKRGKRGGVQRRLRKFGLNHCSRTPPLPSVLLSNVQSIRNKIDELEACALHLKEYRDMCVMAFTETWLSDRDADDDLRITGFGCPFCLDRSAVVTGKSVGGECVSM
jgi:hypothetical protein